MKKKVSMIILSIMGVTLLGIGIYHSSAANADPNLSTDEIRDLVRDQYPGEITELEMEKRGDRTVYEVEVESDGKEYDIELDGNSAEVLNLKEKELVKKEKKNDAKNTSDNVKTNDKSNKDNDDSNEQVASKEKQTIIDRAKAEEIALNEFSGNIEEIELDEDDGRLRYEIELEDGDREAEIDIDAFTGEIIVLEIDEE
ncbi:PepSY domain-containing protein [Oceanobacillus halotolerans]|uniref:PepSY domain-containing protein n=1 Tax=Oceanobacillus halotolerans TaxID=2663380 RepID=UPI0013DD1ADE|nr:PepSY domain-containing protein [Oceanobacillus halotolerans]